MANNVYCDYYFYGPKVKEFIDVLKSITNDDNIECPIDTEDLYKAFNIEGEPERFYIESIEETENGVVIETWNAWYPRYEFWDDVCATFGEYDGDLDEYNIYNNVAYVAYAIDGDCFYNICNTDWSSIFYTTKYALFYDEDEDEDECSYTMDEYFSSLDSIKTFIEDYKIKNYFIIQINDEIELFGERPCAVDLDGNEVELPYEIAQYYEDEE